MARARPPPSARVRQRLARQLGSALADELPDGYQRLGRVLVVRVPESLWPHRLAVGEAWRSELGVETVLARTGGIAGELRQPVVAVIAGGPTETEVVEHGVRWKLDAAKIMFASGNRTERQRIRGLVQPGERVADLFAGIGYFAIPAALSGPSTRVEAVEKNPTAHKFLQENARLNGVAERVAALLGDNREVTLRAGEFDRVLLGWLPDSLPWLRRAVPLLRRAGGTVHVHRVADARRPLEAVADDVGRELAASGGRLTRPIFVREVKPYGPGRRHVVVDVAAAPV